MGRVEVTHRVTVRRASIPELQTDLRLRYRDQDYQVRYPKVLRTLINLK